MKLKSKPDDFRVEEIAEPALGSGPFALYRLAKKSLGTPEAINAICRAWRLSREAIAVGGLKDRHAATRQFLSIENGPHRNLDQTNLTLEYLGQTARRFESKDILANHFEITVRDLRPQEADSILVGLPQVSEAGVPNYFDDQRFGSVGVSGDFVARAWCLGDYERALWLALAESNGTTVPTFGKKKTRCAPFGGIGRPAGRRPSGRRSVQRWSACAASLTTFAAPLSGFRNTNGGSTWRLFRAACGIGFWPNGSAGCSGRPNSSTSRLPVRRSRFTTSCRSPKSADNWERHYRFHRPASGPNWGRSPSSTSVWRGSSASSAARFA